MSSRSCRRTSARLGEGSLPNLGQVEFRTVHGVKGLEADFVVVTGLEAGRNGFPADKPSDSFHEMFLPPKESFQFAEERRLFYVALTRARHRVYLLFDAVVHSPFVRELREGGYPIAEGEFSGRLRPDRAADQCRAHGVPPAKFGRGWESTECSMAAIDFRPAATGSVAVGPAGACCSRVGDYLRVQQPELRRCAPRVSEVQCTDGASKWPVWHVLRLLELRSGRPDRAVCRHREVAQAAGGGWNCEARLERSSVGSEGLG